METIAALVTPNGAGGLAVLRLSGSAAISIANECFQPARGRPLSAGEDDHRALFGHAHAQGQRLDECVATVFQGPRSYTGEDTVEFGCHGSPVIVRQVLTALLRAGARLAEPGEFTRRAFENGKLDLVQAEAVLDLVHAHGDRSAQLALSQLSGRLSQRIRGFRESLIPLVAELQAELEFPDEELSFERREELLRQARNTWAEMSDLLATYEEGRQLGQGYTCVLAGAVNAGKSTLSNALLGQDRSIVTEFPGTTRDLVESVASIRGLSVTLIDTAGLRESPDPIEQEGIRRSRASIEGADLVLVVADSASGFSGLEQEVLGRRADLGLPAILVWNKTDLPHSRPVPAEWAAQAVALSAIQGLGLEVLRDSIARSLAPLSAGAGEKLLLSSTRQRDALQKAQEALDRACVGFQTELGAELVVEDLRQTLQQLGRILGETTPDDVLDDLFRRFCIGK